MLVPKLSEDTDRKRILLIGTVISGMFIYWYWEAKLISYYVVPTKDAPFNTLEEFLQRTSKKVGQILFHLYEQIEIIFHFD